MPLWYKQADAWLLEQGWPVLLAASAIVIGITLYLVWKRQAIPLAGWLTYLFMP